MRRRGREPEPLAEADDEDALEGDALAAAPGDPHLVGLNMCGCAPGSECSTMLFESAAAAFDHARQTHFPPASSARQCPWWGCTAVLGKHARLVNHYATQHLKASLRCSHCGASYYFTQRRAARECVHQQQRVQATAKTAVCLYGPACQALPDEELAPVDLMDHCVGHVNREPDPPSGQLMPCRWDGCGALVHGSVALQRHLREHHVQLKFRCIACDALHKNVDRALACCAPKDFELVVWSTKGATCQWEGCAGVEAQAGPAADLRTHLGTHLGGRDMKVCLWKGCGKKLNGSRTSLKTHLEVVHGHLKLRCSRCHELHSIKDKKKALLCTHARKTRNKRAARAPVEEEEEADDDEEVD